MKKKLSCMIFRVIRWIVKLVYRKYRIEGQENLPEEPVVIVGNHSQLHGPLACELYFPDQYYTWCAGQMMQLKEVPAYTFQDFWSYKPKSVRWIYKIISYLIAPLSVCLFTNARTIGVYRDARIISTFKNTVNKLQQGSSVVVFPEHYEPHNHVINDFQDKFIDIAKLYYKRSGKELTFVPMYIAPNLKTMYLCEPIRYQADGDMAQERERICNHLMDRITEKAMSLPVHTVVPYANLPKKQYPKNKEVE